MKSIRYLIALLALGFLTTQAHAVLGPVSINLTATFQSLSGKQVNKTNITATTTNVSSTLIYTTTNLVINNARLIKMLANSFNTNLPASATLKVETNEFVVASGSTILLRVGSVLHFGQGFTGTGGDTVFAGSLTFNQKATPILESEVVFEKATGTSFDNLTYDDSLLTTADGTTTNFKIEGIRTSHLNGSASFVNSVSKSNGSVTSSMTGAGSGTISGKDAILKGSAAATALGLFSL